MNANKIYKGMIKERNKLKYAILFLLLLLVSYYGFSQKVDTHAHLKSYRDLKIPKATEFKQAQKEQGQVCIDLIKAIDPNKSIDTLLSLFDINGKEWEEGIQIIKQFFLLEKQKNNKSNSTTLREISNAAIEEIGKLSIDSISSIKLNILQSKIEDVIRNRKNPEYPSSSTFRQIQTVIGAYLAEELVKARIIQINKNLISTPTPEPDSTPPSSNPIKQLETSLKDTEQKLKNRTIIGSALGGLLLLLSMILFFLLSKKANTERLNRKHGDLQQKFNALKSRGYFSTTTVTPPRNENQNIISDLKKRLDFVELELSRLPKKKSEPSKLQPAITNEVVVKQENRSSSSSRETMFSAPPNKNGTFFSRKLSSDLKTTEHTYQISIVNDQEATYSLVNNQAVMRIALNMPDDYILPAMEIKGDRNANRSQNVRSTEGKLKKEGDNWKIVEKGTFYYL
ncbi:MAG: hypothetical protein AAFO82_08485 [Bacteroidota bacterium]